MIESDKAFYDLFVDFYKQRLTDRGISVLVPDENDIETVNTVIFDELCVGKISDVSREKLKEIINKASVCVYRF